ncbi:TPA: YibE/F family protein [Candidatus Scatousia excrementigallinarum]|uniref:YibE/F family protein n=1 Tax=Candidatus Scatousia excrementigallinarum TaxID=2840935 RepID=A0A9D1EZX3_9BACT|nr:YibE/F family protein [Candidatus Scatousia excrementigallinarum]
MKNFIIAGFLILGLLCPVFAVDKTELPSETGIVESIQYEDVDGLQQGDNSVKQVALVKVLSGKYKGTERLIDNMLTGNPAYDINLNKGDKVILHAERKSDEIIDADDVDFFIADIKRDSALLWISALFVLLLLAIGRKKGVYSLLSIIATVALIFFMLMPMILSGFCPIASAVLVGILSTVITIYLVGGFNSKSSSAIIGTSMSLIFAGGLSLLTIYFAHLTGFAGEESMFLYSAHPELDFQGLLSASMIIAALGALMDTGVSIASAINEIYETDSSLSVRQLFKSGMNIGKDVIGTMSNTLILVYLGSALPLVLLSSNIDLQKFFNLNQVATEISSAVIGSIAILLCVPLTALISAYLIKNQKQNIEFDFDNKE